MNGIATDAAFWSRPAPSGSAAADRETSVPGARLAASLVFVAALYAFVLCFINTRVTAIGGSAPLVAVEGVVLMIALVLLSRRISLIGLVVCLALAVNFCVLSIARENVDLKALRDLLMVVVFVWLGFAYGSPQIAERTLRVIASIAVVVGLVDLVAPDFYRTLFDSLSFYEARGTLGSNKYVLLTLIERPSGIGRSILPFLGPRRIPSIFLEPVSMGNFAVIIGAWALAKDRTERRQTVMLMLLAAAVVTLADARFGGLALLLMAMARMCGLWRLRWLHALLPLVGGALTLIVAWMRTGQQWTDDFLGRLLRAGEHLQGLDAGAWLGVPQDILLDAGYGYVIQQFGVVICIGLWCVYCLLPMDDRGERFRFNASLYIALILSVSGSSLFALKTVAILSFLLGSLIVHPVRVSRSPNSPPLRADLDPWPT